MISPYMNSEDIETVRIAFKKLQSIILDTIMFRKYLFFDLNTKTKEETIRQMIDQTKAYIPLNENFFEAVMEREIQASTEFDGRIAIPHPMSVADLPEFIAVARLEKPILWKRRPVQLVFLMCSSHTTNPLIYQKLGRIMKNPELTQNLLNAKDFDEFVYIFETI